MNASSPHFLKRIFFFIIILHITSQSLYAHNSTVLVNQNQNKIKPIKNNRTRKKSTKKNTPSYKNKRNYIKDMNYTELKETQERAIANNNNEFAIKCTEQLIKICSNIDALSKLTLVLANLYFQTDDFQVAFRLYNEFIVMYPGSSQLEFAYYRAILAQFNLTLESDRDQTYTQTTIALADQFLSRSSIFTHYINQVEDIRKKCYIKQAQSELNICSFYINQNNFKAAHNRLNTLRSDDFLKHIPLIESDLVALESTLALKEQKSMIPLSQTVLALDKQNENEHTTVATNNTRNQMKNRF